MKENAENADYTVDADSKHSTVCIKDTAGVQDDIFLQGIEADHFNDKAEEMYNDLREVTLAEVELHLARDYVENLWN